MSAILDEPAVRARALRITVPFYHELGRLGLVDKSVELLDGVIVEKMSKSPLHSSVSRRLAVLIAASLRQGQILLREDPITTSASEPEPDIAVVNGSEDDFVEHHPETAELVVEIAVSSVEIDRRKAIIYAEANVGEYWLVEPERECVTVYRAPAQGGYADVSTLSASDTLTCSALPGLRIPLSEIFRR
jgi:Uma2 family endonuclease